MVKDALRAYLSLAGGLSDVTTARARSAARALVEQGEATAGQVSALAEDLMATSRRNRESVALLLRHEVEQAVRRLGLASASDSEDLLRRVRQLERSVRELQAQVRALTAGSGEPASPAKRSTAAASKRSASRTTTSSPKRAQGRGASARKQDGAR